MRTGDAERWLEKSNRDPVGKRRSTDTSFQDAEAPSLLDIAKRGFSGPTSSVPHQREMETAFGRSFNNVHVYLDKSDTNRELRARAYTVGNNIAFRDSNPNEAVIAHDLAQMFDPISLAYGAGIDFATAGQGDAYLVGRGDGGIGMRPGGRGGGGSAHGRIRGVRRSNHRELDC